MLYDSKVQHILSIHKKVTSVGVHLLRIIYGNKDGIRLANSTISSRLHMMKMIFCKVMAAPFVGTWKRGVDINNNSRE